MGCATVTGCASHAVQLKFSSGAAPLDPAQHSTLNREGEGLEKWSVKSSGMICECDYIVHAGGTDLVSA